MTAATAVSVGTTASEGAKALWTLVLVLGGAVATLAVLDAIPGWLHGEPRGVRRVASLEEAERRLQARAALPSYFPDTYVWPPSVVRITRDEGGAVGMTFTDRAGAPSLVYAQTLASAAPLPAGLVGRAAVIQQQSAALGEEGTLARVVAEDGALWNQLEWTARERRFLLRSRGSLEDMLRMARSVHGGGH
jgi:hypothetical protein